jgi:hypothetical protein
MAHFAHITNGIVDNVIVIDAETLATGNWGNPSEWVQTSYNTQAGVHSKNGTPLRKNFAGIGFTYDAGRDAFIPPKPYASWLLNEDTCQWGAPTSAPTDGKNYIWRESTTSWVEQPDYPTDGKTYTWNLETGAWDEVTQGA